MATQFGAMLRPGPAIREGGRIMRIILSSLLTVFLSLSALGSAQVAKPRFVLTISAEAPAAKTGPASYSVKAGSEVFITVHLTNTSQRNLALGYDADSRTGVVFGHQYEIHD